MNYVGSGDAAWSDNGYSNIQNNPLYIPRSGSFGSGSFNFRASVGYLWSGTTGSGTDAYNLYYGSSVVYPAGSPNRQLGFPVRCIAHYCAGSSDFGYLLVEQGITSSFGTMSQALNWNTNGYSNIQKVALYIIRSGFFNDNIFDGQAARGYLWSDTTSSNTGAYDLGYYGSNVGPAESNNRQLGMPVRCIASRNHIIIKN